MSVTARVLLLHGALVALLLALATNIGVGTI